jgi:hypothetical protein
MLESNIQVAHAIEAPSSLISSNNFDSLIPAQIRTVESMGMVNAEERFRTYLSTARTQNKNFLISQLGPVEAEGCVAFCFGTEVYGDQNQPHYENGGFGNGNFGGNTTEFGGDSNNNYYEENNYEDGPYYDDPKGYDGVEGYNEDEGCYDANGNFVYCFGQ